MQVQRRREDRRVISVVPFPQAIDKRPVKSRRTVSRFVLHLRVPSPGRSVSSHPTRLLPR